MADVDNSDFSRLASDLGRASDASWRNMQTAIEVTARNVKDTWRDNAKGMPHAPAFPFSITYDVGVGWDQSVGQAVESVVSGSVSSARGTTLRAEIGPDKGRAQGALGNLIEYGSVNNAPMGLGHGALQANEADFERGIDKSVDDALRAAGL